MTAHLLAEALTTFGAAPTAAARPADARSGAGVHRVRTAGGTPAYLKVTPAALGEAALAGAERELRFYGRLAPAVPVATPVLLDALRGPAGIALLLSDAGATHPPSGWTDRDWSRLGRDLALLHAAPAPQGDWTRTDSLRAALADPDLDRIRAFWSSVLPSLESLLTNRDQIAARLDARPSHLVHGDCHTGNIVHAEHGLAFCDWQSAGFGRASSDLAFLSVRAAPAGVEIPAALVEAYLAHRPADPVAFRRAVLLEELAVYVFEWPAYAAYNDATGIERVQRRAAAVADRLGSDIPGWRQR